MAAFMFHTISVISKANTISLPHQWETIPEHGHDPHQNTFLCQHCSCPTRDELGRTLKEFQMSLRFVGSASEALLTIVIGE
jgi:hypothetical protein